ncbi:MAG: hypothetical protein JXN10_08405, partial [Clostridia bacterium]|nr:hypothetical protein [Clostridia bacterium]MBN2883537.1 hypothetical protein [Clostridia bacterium]
MYKDRYFMKKIMPFFLPVFRSILFVAGGVILSATTGLPLSESARWWTPVCILMNLITIAVLFGICKMEGVSFKSLIIGHGEKIRIKSAVIITLVMSLLGVGGMILFSIIFYGGPPLMLTQPLPVWVAAASLILLPVTIVFAEMPLYFGYSFNRLRGITNKPALSLGYVVFFYALQHSFMPVIWEFKYVLFRFLSFLPLMIVLGIIYHKKRKLPEMMIGHGAM